MIRKLSALAVAGLVVVGGEASAQSQPVSSASVASPRATIGKSDPNAEMSAALRTLITTQEKYWADHGTYTTDAVALGTYPYPKDQLLMVQVIFAGSRGWTGIATYRGLQGKSCVVYVGNEAELPKIPTTRADNTVAKGEGQPTCDAP